MSEYTPERLLHEPVHAPTCRRYIEGMQNTMASECTCFLAKYVAAWEADRRRLGPELDYSALCDQLEATERRLDIILRAINGVRGVRRGSMFCPVCRGDSRDGGPIHHELGCAAAREGGET